jgi:hypothetical protein
MKQINESLRAGDLRHFVKPIFEIDGFASKIGDDEDIVTVSFTVDSEDPAKDMEHFIEMGYEFVLDADISPGELDDGKYRVYVEIERNRHAAKQIRELLNGIEMISGESDMRFRYYKSFRSQAATLENLEAAIPMDPQSYKNTIESQSLNNFSNFFSNSFADNVDVVGESISFKRIYGDTVKFDIITSGTRQAVYEAVKGPIILESAGMAEVMFLSKYIGNYNITKIGDKFIFENNGWAVALERKK